MGLYRRTRKIFKNELDMSEIAVEFKNITKRFPGVLALNDVSVSISRGSCHALVGENGAGKSTLGKILAGIHMADEGSIFVDGKAVCIRNPIDALANGIGMVHQELAFCENMAVAENLCLGQMPSKRGFISYKLMAETARNMLNRIGANIDVNRRLGSLTISQQQLIQIASAVGRGARILIFDEPTSSLSQAESNHLFDLINKLRQDGVTSIYVSHRMEEIFKLCDSITVLRDGKLVDTKKVSEVDEASLVSMMIGRSIDAYFPSHLAHEAGEELLRVDKLSSPGKFKDISFSLKAGEIVGFAGLVGSGRTELAEAIFGLDPLSTGNIEIMGSKTDIYRPSQAMGKGIGLVPEDRKRHGLILSMNARENITLPILNWISKFGWVNQRKENEIAAKYFKIMRVKAPNLNTISAGLSGGNQQKLIMARWLAAKCKILLVDEPTRGVDVGAKAEIHALIDQLASEGSGIMLISSELPEVINLSTRIIVLKDGKIAGEILRKDCSQDSVMSLMAGVAN